MTADNGGRRRPRLVLQTVVALSLLGMGVVGLGLVLFTATVHRSVAYESRTGALRSLIEHAAQARLERMAGAQRLVALEVQRRAVRLGTSPPGTARLRALLAAVHAEAPAWAVTGLRLLDAEGVSVIQFGQPAQGCSAPPAGGLAGASAAPRQCLVDGQPIHSLLLPLPEAAAPGFIEVIGDPAAALAAIGGSAGLAVRVERASGGLLHAAGAWPADSRVGDYVVARHLTRADAGEPVFAVRAATPVGWLSGQLAEARDFALLASAFVVGLALLAALVALRWLLRPLGALQQAAETVAHERDIANCPTVAEAGPPEIATPIRSFNTMVERVRSLIAELEGEVRQRRQAEGSANRERELAEAHAQSASQAREFAHATLEAVVDAVIATDTQGRIEYMNPVAETLLGVAEREALGRELEAVVQLYDAMASEPRRHLVAQCLAAPTADRARYLGRLLPTAQAAPEPGTARYVDYAVVAMRDREGSTVGVVLILHDVTEAQQMTERLRYQATHDALTGLINRYEFEERLQCTLAASKDDVGEAVLCYLDLDQFKLVNDTCGHVAGDALLRQLALMLGDRVGTRGTLARLGGDEFGLLIQPCDLDTARALADELRRSIQQFRFVWDDRLFAIGVSTGVVAVTPDNLTTDELLSAADTACYLAKEAGRNRIQVHQPDDAAIRARRAEMDWVAVINRALEADRFELYSQAIVELLAPEPVRHFELLVRLRDAEGRLWQPGSFLPAAERYDLAPALDRWVIEHALAWLAASPPHAAALYAINLSGRSLASDGFLEVVLAAIEANGVAPHNLCFEITETAAVSSLARARYFMEALRDRGCRFSLDDFGSGLSSFHYLHELPVDFLKIDGAFVHDVDRNPVHRAIVGSINEVGHSMSMYTIAEYAESRTVIECLREVGVDYVQGYGYARPQPLDGAGGIAEG